MRIFLALGLLLMTVFSASLSYACTGACSTAGQISFCTDIYRFCDGAEWQDLPAETRTGSCSISGRIIYDSNSLYFCDGSSTRYLYNNNDPDIDGVCVIDGRIQWDDPNQRIEFCNGTNWVVIASGSVGGGGGGGGGSSSSGELFCWGTESTGELGDGDPASEVNLNATGVSLPSGVTGWSEVSATDDHTCAIANTDDIYCWGLAGNGRLGNGTTSPNVSTPTLVTNPSGVTSWSGLSVGAAHACAISVTDDQLYCWGQGGDGRLGNGATSNNTTAAAVTNPSGVTGWSLVSAGVSHTCAIADDNQLYCWGAGGNGRLGNGTTSNNFTPVSVTNPSGVTAWTWVTAGSNFSCGITSTGAAYCWGDGRQTGNSGALGYGNTTAQSSVPLAVSNPSGVTGWKMIEAKNRSTCAMTNTDQLYCWGEGNAGRLGTGSGDDESAPALVINPTGVTSWTSLDVGNAHACAIADTQAFYCWGSRNAGRLGNGSTGGFATTPETIVNPAGVSEWSAVTTSNLFSCGITAFADSGGGDGGGSPPDTTAPTLSSSSPSDGAVSVSPSGNIVLTFSEAIAAGTGNIVIADTTGTGTDTRTIAVTNSQITVSGNTVTINPSTNLLSNNEYQILISSGVIEDSAGNDFAGLTSGNLNFTTADAAAPTLSSSTPSDEATNVTASSNIVLTFSETVVAGTGNIIIEDTTGMGADTRTIAITNSQITISGNTVTINPSADLSDANSYQVTMASGVIEDSAGNDFSGLSTGDLNFTTAAIMANAAYCWGLSSRGVLGDADNSGTNITTPQLFPYPNGVDQFIEIASGGDHACALTDDNRAYCWGRATSGQLGNGFSSSGSFSPDEVPLPSGTGVIGWSQITSGLNHTCAITNAASAYCWGSSSAGQIGNASASLNNIRPVEVDNPSDVTGWIDISAGEEHTCAITNTGNAYCWGEQRSGRLGNGETAFADITTPTQVTNPSGITSWVEVSAGDDHSCGIANSGDAYCWGNDNNGILGNGASFNSSATPSLVVKPSGVSSWSTVVSHGGGNCALANTGDIYCWGSSTRGRLGNGQSSGDATTPSLVVKPSGVSSWKVLGDSYRGFGGGHCAIANNDNLYCWGDGGAGEMGNGTTTTTNTTPVQVTNPSGITEWSAVSGLSNVVTSGFVCAISGELPSAGIDTTSPTISSSIPDDEDTDITFDGTITLNFNENIAAGSGNIVIADITGLGTDTRTISITDSSQITIVGAAIVIDPTDDFLLANSYQVTIASGVIEDSAGNDFVGLSSGDLNFTTEATMTLVGDLYCWGNDTFGQLGNGSSVTGEQKSPIAVELPSGVSSWLSVDAGMLDHTCAIADTGNIYCWGNGSDGRIGNNSSSGFILSPTQATNPSGVASWEKIELGEETTCGIANNDQAYCWGEGRSGRLGDGGTADNRVPTLVTLPSGITGWIDISTGDDHTCGIANTGAAYCWGESSLSALGNGTPTTDLTTPSLVTNPSSVTSWTSIAAAEASSCGIANTGNVYCWGRESDGELGNGGGLSGTFSTPQLVTNPSGVTSWSGITLGDSHACGIANTGNVYCWGRDASGQLGNGSSSSGDQSTPDQVTNPSGVTSWTALNAGDDQTCGLANTGQVYCWGFNGSSELGVGDDVTVSFAVPEAIDNPSGVSSYIDITSGGVHGCAIASP